jgi:hypothetical protein
VSEELEQPDIAPARLGEEDIRRIIDGTVAALAEKITSAAPVADASEKEEARAALEQQLEELRRSAEEYRTRAEAAEKAATVREELRKRGVTNVELAYRAIREDLTRGESGDIRAKTAGGEVALAEYLGQFLQSNPELMPARRLGGAGSSGGAEGESAGLDMDSIRPGMDPAEMERARREVARVISQSLRRD